MKDALVENLRLELEMSERKLLRLQRRTFLDGFEAEDIGLWTMLDLMTLILIFFIILYADLIPLTRSPILKQVPVTLTQILKPNGIQERAVNKTRAGKRSFSKNDASLMDIEENMHRVMEGTDIEDYSIEATQNRIVLTIGEKISFPVGQAQLLDHIKRPLEKMTRFLYKEQAYRIIVSGHTDDTPIHTMRFPSNWELSVARAMSVANFMMAHNLDPSRISVEGFGQYRPIADNEDPDSRQANRRVEISLIQEP